MFLRNNNVSNFDILTQILPPLTLKYKTELFKECPKFTAESTENIRLMENAGERVYPIKTE